MSPNDRPQVDPSFRPSSYGFSEDLQPQAAPVNTYVQPATPAPSSLHGLAQALSGFSQDLGGFMKQQQAKQDARDKTLGEAAAMKANGVGYAEGVPQGLIPSYASPVFVQSYKQAQGAILGKRLAAGALDAYQTWDGRNSQDPSNMDTFVGNYVKQNLNTNDPDVLAGALPYVHSTTDALYSANEKDRSQQLYQNSVNTHIASSSMNIDNEQDLSLTQGRTPNYDGLWQQMLQDRQQALNSGIRADDYDKSMVAMIQSKALEYMDPALLGLLKNKVPGQPYAYGDTVDGQKVLNDTLTTMESRQAAVERVKAEAQAKQDKQDLEALTGKVIGQLSKDPSAPIDPALIQQGVQLGDGAFAVHAKEWAKTLASPVPEVEDPASITELQRQVINGAPLSAITDEIGRDIHDPKTLAGLVGLHNTMMTKGTDAVLQNPTVKRSLAYLGQSFPSKDDTGTIIVGSASPDSIQAQNDFIIGMAEWYREHPEADYGAIATFATKLLSDFEVTIPDISARGEAHYVRPEAVTRDMQGSGAQPNGVDPQGQPQAVPKPALTDDTEMQQLNRAVQQATNAPADPELVPWSGDEPPSLDQLPPAQRQMIDDVATKLGVDPQYVIEGTYARMQAARPKLSPASAPTPNAMEGEEAGDVPTLATGDAGRPPYWNAN